MALGPFLTQSGLGAGGFAEREIMERRARDRRVHSGLIPAAFITLPHFSVSSAMSLPKSVAEPTRATAPRSAKLAFILGSARPALISLLSFSTISTGVFFGATTPLHPLDS